MSPLRTLILDNARLSLVLLALALAIKAMVPAGFMLVPGKDRTLTVMICSAASAEPREIKLVIPADGAGSSNQDQRAAKDKPCTFSGLGQLALSGADPLLLVALLAFILLIGIGPRRAPRLRDAPFLRPPLRAPPVPFVC